MDRERWTAVDDYSTDLFGLADPVLDAAIEASTAAGLPSIQVSAPQGRLLNVLARAMAARSILEIGTLGGYSAIWLGRAVEPDGRVITLEADDRHAAVARSNLARAGLDGIVEVRVGRAQQTLPALVREGAGPFDLVFIDADKPGYTEYLDLALQLSKPGTLIIADNVVRDGAIIDAANEDPNVRGIRRFHDAVAREQRLAATVLQTVGTKGYDGLTFAVVTS